MQPDELNAAIVRFLQNAEQELAGHVNAVTTSVQQAVAGGPAATVGTGGSQGAIVSTPHASDHRDGAFRQLASFATQAGCTGASVLRRLAPYGLQIIVSSACYSCGLGLFQLLGHSLRISSNTRVISSCLGCLGVGVSSAFAGHMSRHVHHQLERSGPTGLLLVPPWQQFNPDEALLDAVVGITCFKLWKGQFKSLMPSNLYEPGAWAVHSLPVDGGPATSGQRYAQGNDRAQLQAFLKRDGCHHCGSKKGSVIGDHIPPTKIFSQMRADKQAAAKEAAAVAASGIAQPPWAKAISQVNRLLLGDKAPGVPLRRQRFYPQCKTCCTAQAHALRHNKSPLIRHWKLWHLPHPGFMPGVLAAMRPLKLGDILSGPPPPSGPAAAASGKGKSGSKVKAGAGAGAGHALSKEVAVAVRAGAWQDAAWWTGAAASLRSLQQEVWGEEVEDGSCDVARAQRGGLWSWAKRMEEAPGLDVWTSVDATEHHLQHLHPHALPQQQQQQLMSPHGVIPQQQPQQVVQQQQQQQDGVSAYGYPLPASGVPQYPQQGVQQQRLHLQQPCVVVEEYEGEGHSGSLSAHTATSQPLSGAVGAGTAACSPQAAPTRSPWSIELPSTPHPTPYRDSWEVPHLREERVQGFATSNPTFHTTPHSNGLHSTGLPVGLPAAHAAAAGGPVTASMEHLLPQPHDAVMAAQYVNMVQGVPHVAPPTHGSLHVRLFPSSQQPQQQPQQQFFWAATSTATAASLKPHRYSSLSSTPTAAAAFQHQGLEVGTPVSAYEHQPSEAGGGAELNIGAPQVLVSKAAELLDAKKPALLEAASMAMAAATGAVNALASAVLSGTPPAAAAARTPAAASPAASKGITSSTCSPMSWPLTSVA